MPSESAWAEKDWERCLEDNHVYSGPPVMSKADAEDCLYRITNNLASLYADMRLFMSRRGWIALGYRTLSLCLEDRKIMTPARWYQIVRAGELQEALEDSPKFLNVAQATERQLRPIASLSESERQNLSEVIDFATESAERIAAIADEARGRLADSGHSCDRSEGRRYCPYCGEEL